MDHHVGHSWSPLDELYIDSNNHCSDIILNMTPANLRLTTAAIYRYIQMDLIWTKLFFLNSMCRFIMPQRSLREIRKAFWLVKNGSTLISSNLIWECCCRCDWKVISFFILAVFKQLLPSVLGYRESRREFIDHMWPVLIPCGVLFCPRQLTAAAHTAGRPLLSCITVQPSSIIHVFCYVIWCNCQLKTNADL